MSFGHHYNPTPHNLVQREAAYKLTVELRAMRCLLAQIEVCQSRLEASRKAELEHIHEEILLLCLGIEKEYMAVLYEGAPC